MHRERGAHSIYATFARLKFAPTFKILPYKLGRRPLQGLRSGAMAPPAPPLGTPLGRPIWENVICTEAFVERNMHLPFTLLIVLPEVQCC